MAAWVTSIIREISSCRHPYRESLTMSFNISPEIWRDIVLTLKNRDQKDVSTVGIRANQTPFAH